MSLKRPHAGEARQKKETTCSSITGTISPYTPPLHSMRNALRSILRKQIPGCCLTPRGIIRGEGGRRILARLGLVCTKSRRDTRRRRRSPPPPLFLALPSMSQRSFDGTTTSDQSHRPARPPRMQGCARTGVPDGACVPALLVPTNVSSCESSGRRARPPGFVPPLLLLSLPLTPISSSVSLTRHAARCLPAPPAAEEKEGARPLYPQPAPLLRGGLLRVRFGTSSLSLRKGPLIIVVVSYGGGQTRIRPGEGPIPSAGGSQWPAHPLASPIPMSVARRRSGRVMRDARDGGLDGDSLLCDGWSCGTKMRSADW